MSLPSNLTPDGDMAKSDKLLAVYVCVKGISTTIICACAFIDTRTLKCCSIILRNLCRLPDTKYLFRYSSRVSIIIVICEVNHTSSAVDWLMSNFLISSFLPFRNLLLLYKSCCVGLVESNATFDPKPVASNSGLDFCQM